MAKSCYLSMYVLLVALASVSAARADEPKNKYPKFEANWPAIPPAWNPGMRQAGIAAADNKALTCKVYGLSDRAKRPIGACPDPQGRLKSKLRPAH